MSTNSSSENDEIPMECNPNYDPYYEFGKYVLQSTYLLSNALLNVLILRVTVFRKKSAFRNNSFFRIYAADLMVGIYKCISELLVSRLFEYITPLCPLLSPYFFTPSIFLKVYFTLSHYSDGVKTISQVFLSFNRLTCVAFPLSHANIWNRILTPSLLLLFILPLGIIWNIIISRVFVNPASGGFSVNYRKAVLWASVSKLHLIYFIVAILFILLFSSVTVYALTILRRRMKSVERSITIASLVISTEFVILAVFQVYFAYFSSTSSPIRPYFLKALDFTYDSLNVFPPVIMVAFSQHLKLELGWTRGTTSSGSVRTSTLTHLA